MKRTLAIASAAAIAGGVVAFSLASYASSGNAPADTTESDAVMAAATSVSTPATPGQRQLLHGERTVKDKDGKIILVDSQRGSVTAVSATSMTVKSDDATTWTWTLNGDTKVRGAHLKAEPASSIKVGDTVVVAGERSGDTRTARAVADPPPNLKDLRSDLRKLRRDLRNLRLH